MPTKKTQPKTKPKTVPKARAMKPRVSPWLSRDITVKDMPEIYELLKKPFPKEDIVKGKMWYGLETEGVRVQTVIDRLNDVLGINHWDYKYATTDEARGKMWAAKCDLTLEIGNWRFIEGTEPNNATKTALELQNENCSKFVLLASRSYTGGCNHMSRQESHKGAITNTLKKCASTFGVAREVYKGIADPDFETTDSDDTIPQKEEDVKTESKLSKPANEHEIPIETEGYTFKNLLTELNSVRDKPTFAKAKEMMDQVKNQLEPEQLTVAVSSLVELEKKFGNN